MSRPCPVRTLRESVGLTQAEAGEQANVSPACVSQWELRTRRMPQHRRDSLELAYRRAKLRAMQPTPLEALVG